MAVFYDGNPSWRFQCPHTHAWRWEQEQRKDSHPGFDDILVRQLTVYLFRDHWDRMKRKNFQKNFPTHGYDDDESRAGSGAMVVVVTWPGQGSKSRQELKVRIQWRSERVLKEVNDDSSLHHELISWHKLVTKWVLRVTSWNYHESGHCVQSIWKQIKWRKRVWSRK